jgi:hypothetical protein
MSRFPHAVMALMNRQGHKCLSSFRMAHYQGLQCVNLLVRLETVWTLNPATFLPTDEEPPGHVCEEVMEEVYSSRLDLLRTWEWTSQRLSSVEDTSTTWSLSLLTQDGLRLTPHTEKTRDVAKSLWREIIPRYELPFSIGSDNRPTFMAEVVQGLAKILKIK